MNKFAIAIHGGAGPDSGYIRENAEGYNKGLEEAINAGYSILQNGGSAVDAVETAVRILEDNPHFNAGRGAALNEDGEVEMCASIMNGQDGNAGAVAIVRNVKNPITLARAVMEKTGHIYLGDSGAARFAKEQGLPMEDPSYFVTPHMEEAYRQAKNEMQGDAKGTPVQKLNKKHGTVGAVALDSHGNLAAATSTGGLEFCKQGRIADSSMIGAGTYASNNTCAVSTTGEGEFHMRYVTAFHIAALMEYKGMNAKEACRYLIHEKCGHISADMGLIAVDKDGNLAAEFNTERMHRGLRSSDGFMEISIYRG